MLPCSARSLGFPVAQDISSKYRLMPAIPFRIMLGVVAVRGAWCAIVSCASASAARYSSLPYTTSLRRSRAVVAAFLVRAACFLLRRAGGKISLDFPQCVPAPLLICAIGS